MHAGKPSFAARVVDVAQGDVRPTFNDETAASINALAATVP